MEPWNLALSVVLGVVTFVFRREFACWHEWSQRAMFPKTKPYSDWTRRSVELLFGVGGVAMALTGFVGLIR